MNQTWLLEIAQNIVSGKEPDLETYRAIAGIPQHEAFCLLPGADLIRNHYFGREVHVCTICNAKSGRCSENCAFCSQSSFSKADIPVYPLLEKTRLQEGGLFAAINPVNRYSVVTSGKRLSKEEVVAIAQALAELNEKDIGLCASLGVLDRDDLAILKNAGVTRYHHNLETSHSHFKHICTTHTYEERVATVRAAQKAGLTVCSGGIIGTGETDQQALELALELKELNVNSIPINFLTPVKGTRLENCRELTPLRCLKIIALFRYVMPDKDILICGGRKDNLKELHPLVFFAGASGIMAGNYLTTKGRMLEEDLDMIENLGLTVRNKILSSAPACG